MRNERNNIYFTAETEKQVNIMLHKNQLQYRI